MSIASQYRWISLFALLLAGQVMAASLRYCAEAGPATFDPALAVSLSDQNAIGSTLFNTLVEAEQPSGRIVPGLATSWTISADGREYRFLLRKDVSFHRTLWFTPSRLMNADDVVFTMQRLFSPGLRVSQAFPVQSSMVLSYGLGKLVLAVEKRGPYEVAIRLREPSAPFLRHLANPFAGIESAEYADRLLAQGKPNELAQRPIGTGPFVLERNVPGSSIRFLRNPHYWKPVALADLLLFDIVPDAAVRAQKLRLGECDLAASAPLADWNALAATPGVRLDTVAGSNIGVMVFNTRHPPLDQAKVRRALDMAIDRNALLRAVYRGRAQLAGALLPASNWAQDVSIAPTAYDPAQARRLLDEAGIAHLKLTLWAMPVQRAYNPDARRMAEMIQADWAKIGITADIVSLEWGEYLQRLGKGEHDAALIGWSLGPDPDSLFSMLQCRAGGFNYAGWCDANFDALIDRARRTSDPAERAPLYREAQALLQRERPLAALAYGQIAMPVRRAVKGFAINPLGVLELEGVLPGDLPPKH